MHHFGLACAIILLSAIALLTSDFAQFKFCRTCENNFKKWSQRTTKVVPNLRLAFTVEMILFSCMLRRLEATSLVD